MDKKQVVQNVQAQLFSLQDLKYRDFHSSLMPTIDKKKVIGVRTPQLRQFAKSFGKTEEAQIFMQVLPHQYYEENNLHSLLIQQIRDYDQCLKEMERFLPYIDNWATCDMLSLNVVKKHLDQFIEVVYGWMQSDRTLYHPAWDRYADALLSGRQVSGGICRKRSKGTVSGVLCKYDACLVFCYSTGQTV